MSNISGKINLLNLHAVIRTEKGKLGPVECLIIPIEKNKLYKSDKGVYLDLIAFDFENKKTESKDTHIVKQSFSKEVREKMTDEQVKALPIIGNLSVWGEVKEAKPVSSPEPIGELDDLPF